MQITIQFEKKSIVVIVAILAILLITYIAYPHISSYLERKEAERAEHLKFKEAERVMLELVEEMDGRMVYIERAMISRETFLDDQERHHPLSNPEVVDYFFFRYKWEGWDSPTSPDELNIRTLVIYKPPGSKEWIIDL